MNPPPRWLFAVLGMAVLLVALWQVSPKIPLLPHGPSIHPPDPHPTIPYLGQDIKLTRSYETYEDYQDDRNNIDPSENARIYNLITHAPVAATLTGRPAFTRAALDLKFPGYGAAFSGERPQPDGSALELVGIEIPRAGKTRFLTYRVRNDVYTLIDDFLDEDAKGIGCVRDATQGQLEYCSFQNQPILTRHPTTHPID